MTLPHRPVTDINILGKDYLTRDEAAHYACVSVSQFDAHASRYGILPFHWMGKTCYRKQDIQRAMEQQWQHSAPAKMQLASRRTGNSNGPTPPAATPSTSAA